MADVSAYPAYPAYEDHGTDILAAFNDTSASQMKSAKTSNAGVGNPGNASTSARRKRSESRKASYNDDIEEAKRFLEANQAGRIGQQVLERRAKHTEYMQQLLERDPARSRRTGLHHNTVSNERGHETHSNAPTEPYFRSQSRNSRPSRPSRQNTTSKLEARTMPAKWEGNDENRINSRTPAEYTAAIRTSVPPPGSKSDPQSFAHKFNQFIHRMSWNERQQSYIFSKRYLMRKPSFVVLPDESSRVVSFKPKDMIKEHPKPVVQPIAKEPRKNPRYMRPVKKPSLSSMSSINYARNGRYSRNVQQQPSLHSQDWVKISLPVKSRNKRYTDDMLRSMGTGSRKTSNGGGSHLPSPLDTPSRSMNVNVPHTPESWVTVRSVFPSIHSIPPPAPGSSASRSAFWGGYSSPRAQRSARSNRSARSTRRYPRSPIKEASVAGLRGQPGLEDLANIENFEDLADFNNFNTHAETTPQPGEPQPVQGYALSSGNLTSSPTALPSSYRPESWRKSAILNQKTKTLPKSQTQPQSQSLLRSQSKGGGQPVVDVVDEAMQFVDVFKVYLERSVVDRTSKEKRKFGLHSPVLSETSLSLSPADDILWSSGSETSSTSSANSSPTMGSSLESEDRSILTVDDVPELESSDRHSIDIADLTPPKKLTGSNKSAHSAGSGHSHSHSHTHSYASSPDNSSRHTDLSRSYYTVKPDRRSVRHSKHVHHKSGSSFPELESPRSRRRWSHDMTSAYSSSESLLSAEFMRMTPLVQGVLTEPVNGDDVVVGPMPLSQLSNSTQYLNTIDFINGSSTDYIDYLESPRPHEEIRPLSSSPKYRSAPEVQDQSAFTLTKSSPPVEDVHNTMPEPLQSQSTHSDSEVSHSDSASMPESATDMAFESAPEIIRRSANQRSLRSKRTRGKRHMRHTTMDSMWEAEDDDEYMYVPPVPPVPPVPTTSTTSTAPTAPTNPPDQ